MLWFGSFGEPDILYLNDGRARFTAISWTNSQKALSLSGHPEKIRWEGPTLPSVN